MAVVPGGLHTPHRDFGEDEGDLPVKGESKRGRL